MRIKVLKWLYDVKEKFDLNTITLFSAIKIMDLFLSRKQIRKNQFQGIATASLDIAAKYEEILTPLFEDYEWISSGTVSRKSLQQIEDVVLNALNWEVSVPSEYHFLEVYAHALHYTKSKRKGEMEKLAKELMVVIMVPIFLDYNPSFKASLALFRYEEQDWNDRLEKLTSYSEATLLEANNELEENLEAYKNIEALQFFLKK